MTSKFKTKGTTWPYKLHREKKAVQHFRKNVKLHFRFNPLITGDHTAKTKYRNFETNIPKYHECGNWG